jgi:GntR family transcriptional regulator/MocR family aminotransferase
MAKKTSALDLALPSRDANIPAYLWLYNSLRAEILQGRLLPGTRLPATRDLASQYGLSRGTTVTAFDQLKAEGYIQGTVGSGTYVSKVLPDDLLKVRRSASASQEPMKSTTNGRRRLSDFAKRAAFLKGYEQRRFQPFRANVPAMDLFPIEQWAQLTARRVRNLSRSMLLGCDAIGYRPFREAVAEYLSSSRGVVCTPDQVAIVSGMQEALDVAARLFINPGDKVGVENPGYGGAVATFEAHGAKISPLRVDEEGVAIDRRALRDCRLIYVTPAHQFPLGITMSLKRRLDLIEWARNSKTVVFEDDYDSEYRYCGKPVPALQGLDCSGQVVFAGSFSKVMFPALRLGYLVVPKDLVEPLAAVKSIATSHSSLLTQAVLCDFMREGHYGRHIRRMREIYSQRQQVLLTEANKRLRGLLEISEIEAGLQTVGWLQEGISGVDAAEMAARHGVEVIPLSRYSKMSSYCMWSKTGFEREGLQLGFAAIDETQIREGVKNLAIALEELATGPGRRAGSSVRPDTRA